MARSRLGTLAFVGVVLLGGAAVWWQGRLRLDDVLRAAVKKHEGAEVRMDQLAGFDWDAMYVATPYQSPEDVDRAIGIAWGGAARSQQQNFDEYQLLVFVAGGKVVASYDVGRTLIAPGRLLPRDEAVFVVRGDNLVLRAPR
ncbi:MAG: hypothetical protein H6835_17700 [Planctomycetes bacterium]|nr:hypothetical protein [Planctomycetota bacterium]